MTPTPSQFRRRLILGGASALVAALVLTGCGRGDGSADTASAADTVDDSPATGTIEFWAGGSDGEALPDFLADFEAANPDVTVNVTQVPSDDFDSKLMTAIASGTVPDMVYLYSQTQATLLDTGAFAAVPDGLVDPDSFFETAQTGTEIDGVSHAVPWYVYAQVFYYRADLAEAAGVEAPTTWEELKTFSAALQADGSEWGTGLSVAYDGYTAQNLNELIYENGGGFISDDDSEWTINSDENIEAAEYWGSLFSEGYASPDGPQFLDTTPWFTTGQMASTVNGPWFPGWLDEANGEGWSAEHVAAVVPPAGPAGSAANLGGGSLAVLDDAENADAAWKLVRYLSEPDTQLAWYETFGNLPAVEAAWDEPLIAEDTLLDAVKEAMDVAIPTPSVPAWGEVSEIIGQQLERVARGEATAQEALDEAQSQAESIGTGVE